MPWRVAFTILAEVRVGSSSVLLPRALHSQPPGDYSTRLGWPQPRHCSALLCSLKALLGFFPRPPGSVHELAWPPRGRSSWAGSSAVSGSWPRCCCGRAAQRRPGSRRWPPSMRGAPSRRPGRTSCARHWTGGRRTSATTAPAPGAAPACSTW